MTLLICILNSCFFPGTSSNDFSFSSSSAILAVTARYSSSFDISTDSGSSVNLDCSSSICLVSSATSSCATPISDCNLLISSLVFFNFAEAEFPRSQVPFNWFCFADSQFFFLVNSVSILAFFFSSNEDFSLETCSSGSSCPQVGQMVSESLNVSASIAFSPESSHSISLILG